MTTFYVEDYEEVTGLKREGFAVETKVVTPPDDTPIFNATEAETK